MEDCCIHQKELRELEDELRTCKKCGLVDHSGYYFNTNVAQRNKQWVWLCNKHFYEITPIIANFMKEK